MIEKKVSEVEDRLIEIPNLKKKIKRKRKLGFRNLWEHSKKSNTCVTINSQREERESTG